MWYSEPPPMERLPADEILSAVASLERALAEERFRSVAGIAREPDLGTLFARHAVAAHRQTAADLREAGEARLADRVAALRAERVAAVHEESWRMREASEPALVDDAWRREDDRALRLAGHARLEEAVARCAPPREAWSEALASARVEVGLAPPTALASEAERLLAETEEPYRDVLGWLARRELGLAPWPRGDLRRADILRLSDLPGYDGIFRAPLLSAELRGALAVLGRDPAALRVDETARSGKWPGAHALGDRVSFAPRGGAGDFLGLFAAAAESLAHSGFRGRPEARDPALAPGAGFAVAALLLDGGWLSSHLGVEKRHRGDLVRALAWRELFALRCLAAALGVASAAEAGRSGQEHAERHREALTRASGAAWPEGFAARDSDASALAARLRGRAIGAALGGLLLERYDEDWWRNPRAREALSGIVAAGSFPEATPLSLAGKALLAKL